MKPWTCAAVIFSQPNNKNNRLFKKGKHQGVRLVFVLFISIVLMCFDFRYHCLGSVRSGFSLLVSPLQYAVDYPVRLWGWLQSLVSTKTQLINENMALKYQQTLLEAQLQKFVAIKEENSQLKQLLLTSNNSEMKVMAAHILSVETSRTRQFIILNKGTREGVFVGQPVFDAKGVMGQIIDAGLMTSTVLLISDSKCAVPVRNSRSGERAILVGTNTLDELSLINLPGTSDTREGDVLVTSGLGRLYPEGYPVGRVRKVTNVPGEAFIKVDVTPIAHLNKTRLVLLVWPGKEHAKLTQQINERLHVLGGTA